MVSVLGKSGSVYDERKHQLVNMSYLGGELEKQRKNLDTLEVCA